MGRTKRKKSFPAYHYPKQFTDKKACERCGLIFSYSSPYLRIHRENKPHLKETKILCHYCIRALACGSKLTGKDFKHT